jgi:5-methylcytosine-specific restriction endonuclease McrA
MDFDLNDWDDDAIRVERNKARELRQSQWWQRKIAKGVCHYCKKPTSPKELTMDHSVPLARGGRTTKGNIVPCCKTCNTRKKQLLPMEWENYLAQFSGNGAP